MSELPKTSDNQKTMAELGDAEPPRLLSNPDRDIFLTLLDADAEPTEAAKKAAARFNKGWHDGEAYHFQLPTTDHEADDVP